jgi:hypothetical protein
MKTVVSESFCITALNISSAEIARITSTFSGGSTVVTPQTAITRAPRFAAAFATANPILPDE